MEYKAVLFDLDGTLLDTVDDIGDAANRVLSNRGYPIHSISTYRLFIGEGVEFIEDYRGNYNVKTKLYDGVPELLDILKLYGLKLAILSNKPDPITKDCAAFYLSEWDFDPITKDCAAFYLSEWDFDVVLGQHDAIPRKPDPQDALEVAERLSIPPSNFIYLGDTAIDMKTAVSAGMFPIGVLWGFRSIEER
ncbi:MAG: HAD family hydrolase [Deltaproteobacteria bacterium]|nr:HAD family hydrolase [Deltaproteobacteria bacterium]